MLIYSFKRAGVTCDVAEKCICLDLIEKQIITTIILPATECHHRRLDVAQILRQAEEDS